MSEKSKPTNPFDTDRIRSEVPVQDVTETVIVGISCRRPKSNEFFRVHPDPAYTLDTFVIEYQNEGELSPTTYFVHPDLWGQIETRHLTKVRFFVCVNKAKVVFLWSCKLPAIGGKNTGASWHTSRMTIADEATRHWLTMWGNTNSGFYEYAKASGDFGEPAFPDETLASLLGKVFVDDRLIAAADHDVLRKLAGEI